MNAELRDVNHLLAPLGVTAVGLTISTAGSLRILAGHTSPLVTVAPPRRTAALRLRRGADSKLEQIPEALESWRPVACPGWEGIDAVEFEFVPDAREVAPHQPRPAPAGSEAEVWAMPFSLHLPPGARHAPRALKIVDDVMSDLQWVNVGPVFSAAWTSRRMGDVLRLTAREPVDSLWVYQPPGPGVGFEVRSMPRGCRTIPSELSPGLTAFRFRDGVRAGDEIDLVLPEGAPDVVVDVALFVTQSAGAPAAPKGCTLVRADEVSCRASPLSTPARLAPEPLRACRGHAGILERAVSRALGLEVALERAAIAKEGGLQPYVWARSRSAEVIGRTTWSAAVALLQDLCPEASFGWGSERVPEVGHVRADRHRLVGSVARGTVLPLADFAGLLETSPTVNPDEVFAALTAPDVVYEFRFGPRRRDVIVVERLVAMVRGRPVSMSYVEVPARPGLLCLSLTGEERPIASASRIAGPESVPVFDIRQVPREDDLVLAKVGSDGRADEFFWPPLAHARADERSRQALLRLKVAASDLLPASTWAAPIVQWPYLLSAALSAIRVHARVPGDWELFRGAWSAERIDDAVALLIKGLEGWRRLAQTITAEDGAVWVRQRWLSPFPEPETARDTPDGPSAVVLRTTAAARGRVSVRVRSGARQLRVLNLGEADPPCLVELPGQDGAAVDCHPDARSLLLAAVYARADPSRPARLIERPPLIQA